MDKSKKPIQEEVIVCSVECEDGVCEIISKPWTDAEVEDFYLQQTSNVPGG